MSRTTPPHPSSHSSRSSHTVTVRPLAYADVTALAARDAEPLTLYRLDESRQHGQTLTQVTLTPDPRPNRRDDDIPHQVVFDAVPDPRDLSGTKWKVNPDHPVGHMIRFETVDQFGTHQGGHAYTTPEAAKAAGDLGTTSSGLLDRLYVESETGEGQDFGLTPVFGAQISLGMIVADIDPDDLAAEVTALLRERYGDRIEAEAKVLTRQVRDRRVDIYDGPGRGELIAANVLDAASAYVARKASWYSEEHPHTPRTPAV